MAVFRIEKTRDYTVMSNHHLRNTDLSLTFFWHTGTSKRTEEAIQQEQTTKTSVTLGAYHPKQLLRECGLLSQEVSTVIGQNRSGVKTFRNQTAKPVR